VVNSVLAESRRTSDEMRPTGILNVWFPEKKYGFIHQDNADGTVLKHFLHEGNIKSGMPKSGATVRFKSVMSRKGLLAVDAEILTEVQS
jgi:cold shock CspA family protein